MKLSELIQQGVLVNYTRCPVCGSIEREPINQVYVHTKYLAALETILSIKVKYPIKKCSVYKCLNCETQYADPWLTTRYSSMLYSAGLSQHKSGWLALHKRFKKIRLTLIFHGSHDSQTKCLSKIYLYAVKAIGGCNSFMQVNCPFSGELLAFRELENPEINFKKELNSLRRNLDKNNVFPKNLYKSLRKKFKIYSRLVPINNICNKNKFIPNERILLYEQSSLCWGTNCSFKGVSCATYSSIVLKAPVQSFRDLESRKDKIDICRFNNLDHFYDPMEVLDRLLDISKICIVHTHVEKLKMQHHFVFSKNFSKYLLSRGYYVIDMTKLLDKAEQENYSQFIISKSIQLD